MGKRYENMGSLSLYREEELVNREVNEERKKLRSFIPACFVICPLPLRSEENGGKEYVKKYNNYTLSIIGKNGIPGGKIARDMLMLFTTEAVCRGEEGRELTLSYDSIGDFEKSIGRISTSKYDYVLTVLEKYAGSMINFEAKRDIMRESNVFPIFREEIRKDLDGEDYEVLRYKRIVNVPFIERMENLEILRERAGKGTAISFKIDLAKQFVDMAKRNAIPIDFSVYKEITSSLVKDIYAWLVYRNNTKMPEDGIFISKNNLLGQFGDENDTNERTKYFRILEAIKEIKRKYYEDLRVEIFDRGSNKQKGIVLKKSKVIMREKDIRYVPLLSI